MLQHLTRESAQLGESNEWGFNVVVTPRSEIQRGGVQVLSHTPILHIFFGKGYEPSCFLNGYFRWKQVTGNRYGR